MKLIKINKPELAENKDVPGLLHCRVEYEVKAAKGRLEYTGPKFTAELWHQVLSFFRWTHKEMQSESQVRLYVNPKLGRWGVWAFPQQARTGMNARELPTQETPEQARARFGSWGSEPSDDWLYFGTVHHHCSASAFQSSTDENNERNQDGLHLTVGRMDAEQHDVHARFYLDGNGYEADLSCFWPLDPGLAAMVPANLHHELARFQMGAKVTVDFPEVWRKNVVELEPSRHELHWELERRGPTGPLMFARVDEALEEISQRCAVQSVPDEQWMAALGMIAADDVHQIIIEACLKHGVTPDELAAEVAQGEFAY